MNIYIIMEPSKSTLFFYILILLAFEGPVVPVGAKIKKCYQCMPREMLKNLITLLQNQKFPEEEKYLAKKEYESIPECIKDASDPKDYGRENVCDEEDVFLAEKLGILWRNVYGVHGRRQHGSMDVDSQAIGFFQGIILMLENMKALNETVDEVRRSEGEGSSEYGSDISSEKGSQSDGSRSRYRPEKDYPWSNNYYDSDGAAAGRALGVDKVPDNFYCAYIRKGSKEIRTCIPGIKRGCLDFDIDDMGETNKARDCGCDDKDLCNSSTNLNASRSGSTFAILAYLVGKFLA